eukprot:CAMPEP_0172519032 /NCGR_PEP_ID=MMETSP1066-20121228/291175_1 /TAXON_ID=671091 /ORGANISM="Coscinodiscus wailesii, Strain CCMP2513" /LENGTH=264 /DNA_ID=CAMNT_0013301537 /DNA_START=379 /DNA_END=1174 /DNA_ORIENTATION=-
MTNGGGKGDREKGRMKTCAFTAVVRLVLSGGVPLDVTCLSRWSDRAYPSFHASSSLITERVDVKGSTVGRVTSEDERRRDAQAVLKDGDLLRRSSPLVVGIKRKAALLAQVRKDVNFLVACGVMDYSLLVGVVSLTDGYYDDDDNTGEERGIERKEGWKHALSLPLRALFSPAAYLSTSLASVVGRTVPTLLSTHPLPYHGAEYPLLPERKEPGGGGGFTISVLLTFCSLGASEKWSNRKPRACWGTIARELVAFRRGSMEGGF